jgi:transposase
LKKSNNYVGIDISKLTFDVAICNSESKYKYFKFANNHEGFIMFLELLNASESICVMEASGTYYLKLATFLSESGIDVCVINPLIIRRFSQMRMNRAKTDKKDAMLIAEYGKTENPNLWEPEAGFVLELKQLKAYLEQLTKNRIGFAVKKNLLIKILLKVKHLKKY